MLVGDDTRVTSLDSETMARTKDSISVGQRIIAFGQMSDASTLDATAGRVRMEVTRLTGNVVQLDPLAVNLVELGGLRPGAFDFNGTGRVRLVRRRSDAVSRSIRPRCRLPASAPTT